MTPEEEQAVAYHVRKLAKLLYKDTDASRMTSLGEIEATVREQLINGCFNRLQKLGLLNLS